MFTDNFFLPTHDQQAVKVYRWSPPIPVIGIVLILHGMAEHALRYDEFAQQLAANGYEVLACDLRGHGQTGQKSGAFGFFAAKNGWRLVYEDIHALIILVKNQYPDQPLFLYGHSMGSFLARTCIGLAGKYLTGVILSGTSVERVSFLRFNRILTSAMSLLLGPKKQAKLLHYLTFGSFNKRFEPSRTPFDWLSRDNKEVDIYCADPFCGFICTFAFFKDLLTGLILINQTEFFDSDYKPPVFLQAGTFDPVSHLGKDIPLLAGKLEKSGFADVSYKLYEGARHELMHELNKNEVIDDILFWLQERIR